ncbi:MAG: hypothetical protein AAB581_00905 [Patescibacteria group bacterium]
MIDQERANQTRVKARALVDDAYAQASIAIENYTAMATGHPFAANEDIQQAIAASRAATDAMVKLKSEIIIEIDNFGKL